MDNCLKRRIGLKKSKDSNSSFSLSTSLFNYINRNQFCVSQINKLGRFIQMQMQSLSLDLDLCCPEQAQPLRLDHTNTPPCPAPKPSSHSEHRFQSISTFSHIGRRSSNLDTLDYILTDEYRLLAIYDGHGDAAVSDYLKQVLLGMLCRHPKLRTDFEQAAREVFAVIEKEIEALPHKKDNSGSTALVVLISEEKVTAVNLGDSRAILVAADGSTVQINKQHTLSNPAEYSAVTAKGGIVLKRGNMYRINGQLNISRSFGDSKLKPYLSSTPQISTVAKGNSKYLILATDGFWQNTTNSKVGQELVSHPPTCNLAKRLYSSCSPKATDNCTVICLSL